MYYGIYMWRTRWLGWMLLQLIWLPLHTHIKSMWTISADRPWWPSSLSFPHIHTHTPTWRSMLFYVDIPEQQLTHTHRVWMKYILWRPKLTANNNNQRPTGKMNLHFFQFHNYVCVCLLCPARRRKVIHCTCYTVTHVVSGIAARHQPISHSSILWNVIIVTCTWSGPYAETETVWRLTQQTIGRWPNLFFGSIVFTRMASTHTRR